MEEVLEEATALSAVCLGRAESVVNMVWFNMLYGH